MKATISLDLEAALEKESQNFKECYLWLEEAMPQVFFREVSQEDVMLIAHNLIGFSTHDFWATIHLKNAAIVMCIDSPDADLKILKHYSDHGIRNYRTFVSKLPMSFLSSDQFLRIAAIHFTGTYQPVEEPFEEEFIEQLRNGVRTRNPQVTDSAFDKLIKVIDDRFLRSLSFEQLVIAIDLYFRAQKRDYCQYEVTYTKEWVSESEDTDETSMHFLLAWRNTPKHLFLYRLARTIHRHGLVMKGVNAAYCESMHGDSILIMSLGIHGSRGEDVWEVANIPSFIREFITVKYFSSFDKVDQHLVSTGQIEGNMGKLVRAMVNFIHQALVHLNPSLYTIEHITNDLSTLGELTCKLVDAFTYKFDPDYINLEKYRGLRDELIKDIHKIDTGHETHDIRRRHVFLQALNLVIYTLKTNFFEYNYSSLCFRLDPDYLKETPGGKELYPVLPFAIFYVKGMHFFGFHIRFADLSRGGLRTIFLKNNERLLLECDRVFSECYNLAYTQHKKNKEIPEGGAKGVIFLRPYHRINHEIEILRKELQEAGEDNETVDKELKRFQIQQKQKHLHQAQRSFILSLLAVVNYRPDGSLTASHTIDYYKKPENIYLGPDENMQPEMIDWIAACSIRQHYRPGSCFISSKPKLGINHKEFGVTSSGVHVYMKEILNYLEIDPEKEDFTVKMTGGPDGDVAGNQILNLYHDYPKTTKLIALTDGSGTIFDPDGLDLHTLVELFWEAKPISHYPPEKLHEEGLLVDQYNKRSKTTFVQQTLCWRNQGGDVSEHWLSSSEMNHLIRHNVHQTLSDLFIPAGGRPRTLNAENWKDFLNKRGEPTSKAIIEGANLYLDTTARQELEKLGVLIVKDSSANKAGVICSSYEVLCGLALGDELFATHREQLIKEILEKVKSWAHEEAKLLLETHRKTDTILTDVSNKISDKIHKFRLQVLNFLENKPLPKDPKHPLNQILIRYFPTTIQNNFPNEILTRVPEQHRKAIIASSLSAEAVYQRGLDWSPTLVDTLPLSNIEINGLI